MAGTLSATITPLAVAPVAAAFSAAGTLGVTSLTPVYTRAAAFSAAGALSAPLIASYPLAAAFTGAGTLSATTSQIYAPAAGFSGTGALSATITAIQPVTFDSVGAGNRAVATSTSWSHTIGATANAVVVAINVASLSTAASATVKVGTTSMTQQGIVASFATPTGPASAFMFVLANPPTGTQTITVTVSTTCTIAANSVSYKNVSSFGTAVTTTGSSGSMTQSSVVSATSRMVAQSFNSGVNNTDTISAYNQTSRYNVPYSSSLGCAMIFGDAPGAATVSFTATQSASGAYAAIAVPLIP